MVEPLPSPRQHPLNSLAARIILVVALATLLTALVVSWVSVHSTYSFLRRQLDASLPALLAQRSEQILAWFEGGHGHLAGVASQAWLHSALRAPEPETALLGGLSRALGDAAVFDGLVLVDRSGRALATVGSADAHRAARAEDRFDPVASIRVLSLPDGGFLPVASAPVSDDQGRVVGVLHGIYDRAGLVHELPALGLPTVAELSLIDAEGHVLWEPGAVAPRPATANGVAIYRSHEGPWVVGAAQPLGAFGWTLVLEQPFRHAFEPVLSVLVQVVAIDLCIVLLFSFLAYRVTQAIVRPIQALSQGARLVSDGHLEVVIPEPRSGDELRLLTHTFNEMTRKLLRNRAEIQSATEQLKSQNQELQRANEVLEQLSITDGLTKLHNHRFFQDYLTREIKRVSRTGEALAMLVVDIDDFKRLNDRLGHAAGDELLKGLARILNESMRESDLVARYGGEEFVVLAPETDLVGAVHLGEKIRAAVESASFILDDSKRLSKMTVSIGIAQYKGSRKYFFHSADRALYRAKAAGKNCVMTDEGEPPSSQDERPRSAGKTA